MRKRVAEKEAAEARDDEVPKVHPDEAETHARAARVHHRAHELQSRHEHANPPDQSA